MKILSCCPYGYYANASAKSYEYVSFVECLRAIGHDVHHFDYIQQAGINREAMNAFFLSLIKSGGYDLVFVMNHKDEFFPDVLSEAMRYSATLGWNCDDDWRWESYSSHLSKHFTFMVTTYRHIYQANKQQHTNLFLSQWGCTGCCDGEHVTKDIGLSFVGKNHGLRLQQVRFLNKHLGIRVFGKDLPVLLSTRKRVKRKLASYLGVDWQDSDSFLKDQDAVKGIWNRSKVSFTPLEDSTNSMLQIKARVFDMGLSGTVMLCQKTEALHEFYEPGKEYLEFESIEECAERAAFLLANEKERKKIAETYYRRTKKEHLWSHRMNALFNEIGLKTG